MKYLRFIILSFFIGSCADLYAQEPMSDGGEKIDTELAEQDDEEEIDSESLIVEVDSEEGELSVAVTDNILDVLKEMFGEDSVGTRFAIYNNDNNITEYDETEQNTLSQKFDVIKGKDNEDYDFTFIRQTLYNENHKAWDYIYERIYNQDGKLIFFVRKYNTYNSGCADVAFERSEYYYSEKGVLVKKTYDIFDSNNNALDLDKCWMQRETYSPYFNLSEFLSQYPLPL